MDKIHPCQKAMQGLTEHKNVSGLGLVLPLFRDAIFHFFFWRTAFYFLLRLFSSFQFNISHEQVAVSACGRAFGYIRNSCFMSERSEGKTPTNTYFFSLFKQTWQYQREDNNLDTYRPRAYSCLPHLHRESRSHPSLLLQLHHFLKFRKSISVFQGPHNLLHKGLHQEWCHLGSPISITVIWQKLTHAH